MIYSFVKYSRSIFEYVKLTTNLRSNFTSSHSRIKESRSEIRQNRWTDCRNDQLIPINFVLDNHRMPTWLGILLLEVSLWTTLRKERNEWNIENRTRLLKLTRLPHWRLPTNSHQLELRRFTPSLNIQEFIFEYVDLTTNPGSDFTSSHSRIKLSRFRNTTEPTKRFSNDEIILTIFVFGNFGMPTWLRCLRGI